MFRSTILTICSLSILLSSKLTEVKCDSDASLDDSNLKQLEELIKNEVLSYMNLMMKENDEELQTILLINGGNGKTSTNSNSNWRAVNSPSTGTVRYGNEQVSGKEYGNTAMELGNSYVTDNANPKIMRNTSKTSSIPQFTNSKIRLPGTEVYNDPETYQLQNQQYQNPNSGFKTNGNEYYNTQSTKLENDIQPTSYSTKKYQFNGPRYQNNLNSNNGYYKPISSPGTERQLEMSSKDGSDSATGQYKFVILNPNQENQIPSEKYARQQKVSNMNQPTQVSRISSPPFSGFRSSSSPSNLPNLSSLSSRTQLSSPNSSTQYYSTDTIEPLDIPSTSPQYIATNSKYTPSPKLISNSPASENLSVSSQSARSIPQYSYSSESLTAPTSTIKISQPSDISSSVSSSSFAPSTQYSQQSGNNRYSVKMVPLTNESRYELPSTINNSNGITNIKTNTSNGKDVSGSNNIANSSETLGGKKIIRIIPVTKSFQSNV